jgi:7-keto-8-aminopelargonate synthetase-like enzyme
VRRGSDILLYFSGCDYFRLARHPKVAAAMAATLQTHGLSVAASRRTTGNHPLYAQLETALAAFFGTETAVVLPDSYFAPMAVAQALAGEFSHVFLDEFAHGALRDAARMFACPATPFRHRDAADLARLLTQAGPSARPIILTDGMFGHDGAVAPLRDYLKILPARGRLLVDDAHGAGILGATGQGTVEHAGVDRRRLLQCTTLSKAFGTYGGVVLASHALRKKILARSRLFAGTTPLPLPLVGAARQALAIVQQEPARRQRLQHNVASLRTRLRDAGWNIAETPGPIIRLPDLSAPQTHALKDRFLAAGIYPPFLKYGPTSARGFFRIVLSSEHTREHLDRVAGVLKA